MKTRIKVNVFGNGKKEFIPQRKIWAFFWIPFRVKSGMRSGLGDVMEDAVFVNLDYAKTFIDNVLTEERAEATRRASSSKTRTIIIKYPNR